jgi:recombinational DNA repair protein RecR
MKVWTLTCAECAMINAHQPCEACPNRKAQIK